MTSSASVILEYEERMLSFRPLGGSVTTLRLRCRMPMGKRSVGSVVSHSRKSCGSQVLKCHRETINSVCTYTVVFTCRICADDCVQLDHRDGGTEVLPQTYHTQRCTNVCMHACMHAHTHIFRVRKCTLWGFSSLSRIFSKVLSHLGSR